MSELDTSNPWTEVWPKPPEANGVVEGPLQVGPPAKLKLGASAYRKMLVEGETLNMGEVEDGKELGNARQMLQNWGIPVASIHNNPNGRVSYVVEATPEERERYRAELDNHRAYQRRAPRSDKGKPRTQKVYKAPQPKAEPEPEPSRQVQLGETMTVIRLELIDNNSMQRITAAFSGGGEVDFVAPAP